VIEDEAVKENIPYRVIGALSFYNRRTVKDILAYAKILANPKDDGSFTRIYNRPARGFGAVSYSKLCHVAEEKEVSNLMVLRRGWYKHVLTGTGLNGARRLKKLFKNLREINPRNVKEIIEAIILWSGYKNYASEIKNPEQRERVLDDLQELVSAAAQYDAANRKKKRAGLAGFLEHAALMQQDRKEQDQEDLVTLMTVHAAKGLEFPHVYLCGAVEGVMPCHPRTDSEIPLSRAEIDEAYEEERRIFYVAATRAEDTLIAYAPQIRFSNGMTYECKPSRFLAEAGAAFTHIHVQRKHQPDLRQNERVHLDPSFHPVTTVTEEQAQSEPSGKLGEVPWQTLKL
jgi:DNA helicase-2/ATP-dependent DNA helicase PcrA